MSKCANCPVADGPCKSETDERYGFFCRMAESGEPSQLASIRVISEQSPPPANYPPLTTQIKNFGKAMVEFAKDGFTLSDDDLVRSRQEICNECPAYNKEDNRCTKCGCGVSAKAKIRSSSCPDGKW